jgi:hypothetical protein
MTAAPTPRQQRTGQVVSALVAAFLLFDAVIHLLNIDAVKSSMTELGYPTRLSPTIGVIELCCVALYAVHRTAVLGAVVLTGFLGGAIATNLRVDKPLISTTLFPLYVAVAMWVGLYLRDAGVRRIAQHMIRGTNDSINANPPPVLVEL